MSSVDEEELVFQAALDMVSKKFEAKLPRLISEIEEARKELEAILSHSSHGADEVKKIVDNLLKKSHTLAGSAGQFGHPGLTELARAVEEVCLSIVEANFKNQDIFPLLISFTKELEDYRF